MSVDFSKKEEKIIKEWRRIKAFEKSVSLRPKSKKFIFYEGPPTANGMPGLHHILARSFKDVVCRYKTMRGFRVDRRAGWDAHGLPVEIQVEKELGFKRKQDIEDYGVALFNKKCEESVLRYKEQWEYLTERMGFWADVKKAYITCDPLYMESLFWILKRAREKKLLREGYRVSPFCVRCATSLSSHEVAQGYADTVSLSIFVKFEIVSSSNESIPEGAHMLVWTTTPWTLPSNAALAIGAQVSYALVKVGEERFILAEDLLGVLDGDYKKEKVFLGKDLESIIYKPLFPFLSDSKDMSVYPASFVTTKEGTGIVHIAPMYGEDDYNLARERDIHSEHKVSEDGTFNELAGEFSGRNIKEAESLIIKKLQESSSIYKTMSYKHTYPFCWRCSTPLIYYARHSWFLAMNSIKESMIEANQKIKWEPSYIKDGRFGEWLRDVKDWALSRSRYWGTPLPIWRCDNKSCDEIKVLGSRADFREATKGKNKYILVRHGLTEKNEKDVFAGKYPEPKKYKLLSKGIGSVEKTAEELKKLGGVDVIISSPFERALQTAQIISKANGGVKIKIDNRIKETYHGEYYEGKHIDVLYKESPDPRRYFYDDLKGSETFAEIQKRMFDCVRDLEKEYKGKKIALVSHGDPLFLLEKAFAGLTIEEAVQKRSSYMISLGGFREVDFAYFPFNQDAELDFHRPYIDEVCFSCSSCGGDMIREPYLADVWFDSGSMPFASARYPFKNKRNIEDGDMFPADYISEAIDQTRGWFYTLLAVSCVLEINKGEPPFKSAISLGHVLDEKGKKMSKSLGNIADPFSLADKYGMDAVRWYFFTSNRPGEVKKFSERDVAKCQRRAISTLYNSMVFVRMYSENEVSPKTAPKTDNILERWILAKLKELAIDVVSRMDNLDVTGASRILEDFIINDLSNWYIRGARRLFQRPKSSKDLKKRAGVALYVLSETSKLIAPFMPFISEEVWREVNKISDKSVHWEEWKINNAATKEDKDVINNMRIAREFSQGILRLRQKEKIRVRQPLSAAFLPRRISSDFLNIIKRESNVLDTIFNKKGIKGKWVKDEESDVEINSYLTDELKKEGYVREFVRRVQEARKNLKLKATDRIEVYYTAPEELVKIIKEDVERIKKETGSLILENSVSRLSEEEATRFEIDKKTTILSAGLSKTNRV